MASPEHEPSSLEVFTHSIRDNDQVAARNVFVKFGHESSSSYILNFLHKGIGSIVALTGVLGVVANQENSGIPTLERGIGLGGSVAFAAAGLWIVRKGIRDDAAEMAKIELMQAQIEIAFPEATIEEIPASIPNPDTIS